MMREANGGNQLRTILESTAMQVQSSAKTARYAEELRELCRQMDATRTLFGMESDEDLLDAAIYQMKALQARQRYLLKRAKGE